MPTKTQLAVQLNSTLNVFVRYTSQEENLSTVFACVCDFKQQGVSCYVKLASYIPAVESKYNIYFIRKTYDYTHLTWILLARERGHTKNDR